jgi:hypothetical protein
LLLAIGLLILHYDFTPAQACARPIAGIRVGSLRRRLADLATAPSDGGAAPARRELGPKWRLQQQVTLQEQVGEVNILRPC